MVKPEDIIPCGLTDEEVKGCIVTALQLSDSMIDRADLHTRTYLERFFDLVMGEISEQTVLKWARDNGKYAESAVDKASGVPDLGHDIYFKRKRGTQTGLVKCSVKSSLSAVISDPSKILSTYSLASKRSEIGDVNVQVYFWLRVSGAPRTTVPSTENMGIIGWLGHKEASLYKEQSYATERRPEIQAKLKDLHPMKELLPYLI